MWKLEYAILPTRSLLARKIRNIVNLCPLCQGEEEIVEHLFFTCRVVKEGWGKVLEWWDVSGLALSRDSMWSNWLKLFKNFRMRNAWHLTIGATL